MPKPPMTRFPNLAIDPNQNTTIKDFVAPKLTQVQIDNDVKTLTALNQTVDGNVVFNTTTKAFNFGANGKYVAGGAVNTTGAVANGNMAVFADASGTLIRDGGPIVGPVGKALFLEVLELDDEPPNNTQISNIGYIQFNNDGSGDILVDSLIGLHLVSNEIAVDDAQICLIMGPGLRTSSTSVSSLFELQSTTGALQVSRMTGVQRDALVQVSGGLGDGMILYNKTTNKFNFREDNTWVEYGTGGSGTVTSITAGTGLTGGTITTSGTIALSDTAVTPGSYTYPNVTVNQQGRLTSIANGTTPILTATGEGGLEVTGTTDIVIRLPFSGVIAGSYTNLNATIDAEGRITTAANGAPSVESITGSAAISVTGDPFNPTLDLTDTGVVAGTYNYSSIVVDAQGRISKAASAPSPVSGPLSSVVNNVVLFNNTSGTLIKDSAIPINDLYRAGNPTTLIDTYGGNYSFFAGTNLGNSLSTGAVGVGSDSQLSISDSNINFGRNIFPTVTGAKNVSMGVDNFLSLTIGGQNISLANSSGNSLIDGNGNLLLGNSTGNFFLHGDDCIFLGNRSKSTVNTLSNTIALGSDLAVGTSNTIILGKTHAVGLGEPNPIYFLQFGPESLTGRKALIYMPGLSSVPLDPPVVDSGLYAVYQSRPFYLSGAGIYTGYLVTTITTGLAPTAGFATLNGTTGVVVMTQAVQTTSKIHPVHHAGVGVPSFATHGTLSIGSIVAGVSFTIYSSNPLDTDGVSWTLVH